MLETKTIDLLGHPTEIFGWPDDVYFQTLERQVEDLALFAACLPDGGVVYDIGANIGVTAIAAAQAGCSVFAFEPAQRALAALRANAEGRTIQVIPRAIGMQSGDIGFTEGQFIAGSHVDAASSTRVQVQRLDDWCAPPNAAAPSLIKIDVEGHEPEVIDGADGVLSSGPLVVMEVNAFTLDAFGGTSTTGLLTTVLERFGRFVYLTEAGVVEVHNIGGVRTLTHRLIVEAGVPCWTDVAFSADAKKIDALKGRLGG